MKMRKPGLAITVATVVICCCAALVLFVIRPSPNEYAHDQSSGVKANAAGVDDTGPEMTVEESRASEPAEQDIESDGLIGSRPEDAIDQQLDSFIVADLCDDAVVQKSLSSIIMLEHYKRTHGADDEVTRTTEALLSKLCRSPSTGPAGGDGYREPRDLLFESSALFQDAAAFVDLLGSTDGNGVSDSEIEAFVVGALKRAGGRYELLETLMLLGETTALRRGLRDYGYPGMIQFDVAASANIVVTCELFGGCTADSPFSAQLCFLECERPLGAEEVARRSVAERNRTEFEQAINAILAARNS